MRWDEATHSRIVKLAHEAVLAPSRWDAVISALASTLGASGASLFTPHVDPDGTFLAATVGGPADSFDQYTKHWVNEDPWLASVAKRRFVWREGTVRFSTDEVPLAELHRTAFYNEFVRHFDIDNVMTLKVAATGNPFAPDTHLSLYESNDSTSPFGNEHVLALQSLWPQLQAAVHAYWTLRKARDFDRVVEESLEALPQPCWVLRRSLQIDHANARARELMSSSAWLKVDPQGLRAIGDLDRAALMSAVGAAAMGGGACWSAAIVQGSRLRRVLLRVVPVAQSAPYATAWPHAQALLTLDLPVPDEVDRLWLARLAAHHRLTPSETRVLERLGAGANPKQIADELQVSYTTVRTHLRALTSKTGCRRQAELVRLLSP